MLEISNIINISVQQSPTGLAALNANNVAMFTDEAPIVVDYGDYGVYVSSAAVGVDFGTDSEVYAQAVALFSQAPNILNGSGVLIVIPLEEAEAIETALTRTKDLVYYNGILAVNSAMPANAALQESFADAVQACGDKMWIFPTNSTGDIAGIISTVKNSSDYATRCLLYTDGAEEARIMGAAYAGRGFSTNFDQSNGCKTMNLKRLTTITPDEGITQTIYSQAETAGADIYVSFGGVPGVRSFGANEYFDQVYNLIWFVNALKVAGFNALATVGTKIPQTEEGMAQLKGAYRQVCEQALRNGYVAPGSWTSPDTFGNQEDFLANVSQRGFYIYSAPVNQQSVADRAARKAPLIQIAIKEAGAIHHSDVVVNINP